MIGAGAAAALTLIGAGLVRLPATADDPALATIVPGPDGADRIDRAGTVKVKRPVRYVRLKPGQKAPKGARVIREAAPTPRIIVQRVETPVAGATRPIRGKVVTRTRQSG